MKLYKLFAVVAACCLIGCSDGKPTSVMENTDQAAVDAYEAAVAAQDAAMEKDPSDADE